LKQKDQWDDSEKVLSQKTDLERSQKGRFWEGTADWRLSIDPYSMEPMLGGGETALHCDHINVFKHRQAFRTKDIILYRKSIAIS
jgi:hypothetical protein